MADDQVISAHAADQYRLFYIITVASVIVCGEAFRQTRGNEMLARLIAAKWLGEGRAVETYLSCTAFVAAVLFLYFPNPIGWSIAIPLLAKAALTGGGLVLSINGIVSWARYLRFGGGLVGCIIWVRVLMELADTPAFITGRCATYNDSMLLLLVAFSAVAILFSIREMALALADLPRERIGNGMARE